ncbi:SurA N-terminal domain-containing protein, partial [Candidatus Woesearchaeota archaeon]|nr:SurA N-terminal domain-containing protein [Candidatus Woesearchaeota archaeon]
MEKIGGKSSVFVAAVAALVVVALAGGCSGKLDTKDENVAATVNGAKIYFGEVNDEYASLSAEQREGVSKADTLSFVIEREILYQQAVKEGLKATKEEQQQAYGQLLLESNVTEPELAGQLAARNSSVEKLKVWLEKQIL